MKASMTWSPVAGLNVVSVERGGQAWTITLDSQRLSVCPGCGRTVQITSQYLLAHAAGPIRPRSSGCYQRSPRTLEVSKPAVRSPHFH
jgi:hypothetical protein